MNASANLINTRHDADSAHLAAEKRIARLLDTPHREIVVQAITPEWILYKADRGRGPTSRMPR